MSKKRKAKVKSKRKAKKTKSKKSPTSNVDAPTPVGPSVASDEALEDAATASKFTKLCG